MTLVITPEIIEPKLAPMSPYAPLAEAGRSVLLKFYNKLINHIPIAKEGEDPEGVHQLRVATRRLRAGLQIMEETVCSPTVVQPLRRKLRAVANSAGQVRDSDVFLIYLDDYGKTLDEESRAEIEVLYQAVRQQRQEGRTAMLAALEDKRTLRGLDELHAFLKDPEAGLLPPPDDPYEVNPSLVSHFSGSSIWRRYEGILAYQTVIPAPVPVLHRLRVTCKRFRYTLDFFEEALPAEAKPIIKQLASVQDVLGELNDYQVKYSLTEQLLANHSFNKALRNYHAYCYNKMQELAKNFMPYWEILSGAEFKRKLANIL
jgi:CHAD domain-containing protein